MKVKKKQPILCLKPTQFAVGLLEVEHKVLEAQELKKKALAKLIDETPIPVVVAPWGDLYVTDHHHFIFMCWHLKVRKLRVKVVKNYSRTRLSYRQFWLRMVQDHRAHLYDQFGTGPREPLYLPPDIRGVADDPYRSLAWMVRKEGGYANSTEQFAEFKWAEFFRKRRLLAKHGRRGFESAVIRANALALSLEARGLPGYSGRRDKKKALPRSHASKSRFIPKAQKTGRLATVPRTE
jgi:hypothetical protein